MSMTIDMSVEGQGLIKKLTITNTTEKLSGTNTYHWVYTDYTRDAFATLMSLKEGFVKHEYEDGAMVLLARVAQAASETES